MDTLHIEPYPFGKTFAVSFIDDTDGATRETVEPVYRLLARHGLRTTKTVWPLPATAPTGLYPRLPQGGETLCDAPYRAFCEELQGDGFEIAMHTASAGNSTREQTLEAYELFEKTFGHPPSTNIMHSRCIDNIYWGADAIQNPLLARLAARVERTPFSGHVEGSPYFWGDVCKERTRYVRLFETLKTNTLAFDPATPFHDPRRPFVNWWFSSSYGAGDRLWRLLSEERLARLSSQRGASLVHMYCRHYCVGPDGSPARVHRRFRRLVERLASHSEGWFAPVVEILDRLRAIRAVRMTARGSEIRIHNPSDQALSDVAVRGPRTIRLRDAQGSCLRSGEQLRIGLLPPQTTRSVISNHAVRCKEYPKPKAPRHNQLLMGQLARVAWQFAHGRKAFIQTGDPPWVATSDRPCAPGGSGATP